MTRAAVAAPERLPWRHREREWTWIAGAGMASALLFSLWPGLDLWISAGFLRADGAFAGNDSALVRGVYAAVPWLGRLAGLLALAVWLWPLRRWPGVARPWRTRVVLLGLALLLGVGGVVNGVLKEHWGRARPVAVLGSDAPARFTPALRPTDQCVHNCSFVSGHAATGFSLIALGLVGSVRRRRRWLAAGLVAGGLVGLMRIAQGGHFASDVVAAGLVMWIVCAALRELALRGRWQRRRRGRPAWR